MPDQQKLNPHDRLRPSGRPKSLDGLQCYACDAPAVTWEHTPPKGFYPRRQEVFKAPKGKDYRRGLLTVPSCEEHNAAKSQDDNFVQVMIGVIATAHAYAFGTPNPHPFVDKLIHRVRSHPRLVKAMFENAEMVPTENGPMVAITPEVDTIVRIVELTARGIYFHEKNYQARWPGTCVVHSPHFLLPDLTRPEGADAVSASLAGLTELHRRNHDGFAVKGPHPDVFAYQLVETGERTVMRLTFYGTFHFVAVSGKPTEADEIESLP